MAGYPRLACAALMLLVSVARAQEDAARKAPPPEAPKVDQPLRWELRVEPATWFVGLSGDITIPRSDTGLGTNAAADQSELGFENPRFTPMGELHLIRGDWRITTRGNIYAADKESFTLAAGQYGDLRFAPGETLRASFDFSNYQLETAYTIHRANLHPLVGGGYAVRSDVDLVVGVGAYDINMDITSLTVPGSSASVDEFFIEPRAGAKWRLEIHERVDVDAQVMFGAMPLDDSSSASVDIIVGFTWRPIDHVGVQIGYRAMFFSLTDESGAEPFEFDGSLQGLYAGVVFEF